MSRLAIRHFTLRALLVLPLAGLGCSFIDDYSRYYVVEDAGTDTGEAECRLGETFCATGCANLQTAHDDCGSCGNACGESQFCVSGRCEDQCLAPYTICSEGTDEVCVDTATTREHCGACGSECGDANATPSCAGGECTLACESGYDDCDGDVATGCEQSLDASAHCGACGAACLEGVACVGGGTCGDELVALSAGMSYTCARNAASDVLCWGQGADSNRVTSVLPLLRDRQASMLSVGATEGCDVTPAGIGCWIANVPFDDSEDHPSLSPMAFDSGGAAYSGGFGPGVIDDNHCVILPGGEMRCWGVNWIGMLGQPEGPVSTPTAPADAVPVSDVSVGSTHVCEVTLAGDVRCRGGNSTGALGYDGPHSETAVDVSLPGPAVDVAAGFGRILPATSTYEGHSVALLADGRVFQWGLGTSTPQEITGIPGEVQDVEAGRNFSCARTSSGDEHQVWCWGDNRWGQLCDGTTDDSVVTPVRAVGLGDVERLSVGQDHFCALEGSAVQCCGRNASGALGAADALDPVQGLSGVAELSLGRGATGTNHTCLRYAGGQLRCWGDDGEGQVSRAASATDAFTPEPPNAERFSRVTTGRAFTCGVRSDGTVLCWGRNDELQRGTEVEGRPVELADGSGQPLRDVVALAAGDDHTCALTVPLALGSIGFGRPSCWGRNAHAQLGIPPSAQSLATSPSTSLDLRMISAGDRFTCAINTQARIVCWGDEAEWRLGVEPASPPVPRSVPQQIPGILGVTRIASGRSHTCALTNRDEVWCWGDNGYLDVALPLVGWGRVDGGTTIGGTPPTLVALPLMADERPVELALGELVSCALTNQGRVLCWGDDRRGQLGRGPGVDPRDPGEVPGLRAAHLGLGATQACAVDLDGGVVCWGSNDRGELGYGDTINRETPGPALDLLAY